MDFSRLKLMATSSSNKRSMEKQTGQARNEPKCLGTFEDTYGASGQPNTQISGAGPAANSDRESLNGAISDLEARADLEDTTIARSQVDLEIKSSPVSSFPTGPANKDGLRYEPLPVTNLEDGLVGWESQDDLEMPFNFPVWRKWTWVGLLSAITLLTPFASSILSPAINSLDQEFGNNNAVVGSMTVSIYLLGYVVGPVFIAPLSEMYGRKPVLSVANAFFCLWQIGCALAPNIGTLIAFRFLSDVDGAGCLTLGGSIIDDLFRPHQRAFAMGMWNIGPLLGPTIGPLLGGFLVKTIGWRFDFWIVFAPATMLILSPLVFSLSLHIAFVFGTVYLLYTTIPTVIEETYGFDPSLSGRVYIALGVGNVLGWLVVTFFSDLAVIRQAQANDGVFVPEMRLTIGIYFGIFLPITLFWYGWSSYFVAHWVSTVLSLVPWGFGIMGLFLSITTYIVDSYPVYAASAIAANVILRSVVGALLPLAGPPMYESLGLGWGNSLLGFICIAMIPLPIMFYKFGARLRKVERLNLEL
ncbi:MFS multidrug transporter [Seiridium cupressi]